MAREAFLSWLAAVVRANAPRADFGSPMFVKDVAALSVGGWGGVGGAGGCAEALA